MNEVMIEDLQSEISRQQMRVQDEIDYLENLKEKLKEFEEGES